MQAILIEAIGKLGQLLANPGADLAAIRATLDAANELHAMAVKWSAAVVEAETSPDDGKAVDLPADAPNPPA